MNEKRWFGTAAVVALGARTPLRFLARTRNEKRVLLFLVTSSLAWTVAASAQQQAIDIRKSVMTVRVYKAGVFSAFGHDHEIAAPIAGGSADTAAHRVELRAVASALRVRDS